MIYIKTNNFINTYIYFYVRTMKKGNDKLTISIDKRIKDLFKEICDEEGLKVGKQIELFLLQELKKRGRVK